jgi:succinoglycan biosynthesis transport protein ExoP
MCHRLTLNPVPGPIDGTRMTLQQFLFILRARWASALLVLLVTVGAAIGASLMLPKQYTAASAVMLDMRSPDPIAGFVMGGAMGPAYMATQVDLIGSERVARQAIKTLGLATSADTRSQWLEATQGKGDFESWLADLLLRQMDVKPSRESSVITISYTSPDGRFAAALANAFMQAYIDTTLELRVDPARQYNAFFDERAKQLRDELETAQNALSAYQKQKGLIATDERLDIENARLSELSSQLVMLQSMAAESSGRQAQANNRPEQMAEVLNNSVVASLSADLAREEIRMKELGSRLGDSHPQVVEQRARLAELKSRIDTATTRASGSVSVNANVSQARVAQVRAALDAQRSKVLQLKSLRDDAAVLQRDVENAQRAYAGMQQRVSQANVESQNTLTNVSVIKRASEPHAPSSPNMRRNALVGVFIGTLLAVAFAMLRELLDRRLRTAADVTAELRQQLLVMLPVAEHARKKAAPETSRVSQVKARVLTGLPRPAAAQKQREVRR